MMGWEQLEQWDKEIEGWEGEQKLLTSKRLDGVEPFGPLCTIEHGADLGVGVLPGLQKRRNTI